MNYFVYGDRFAVETKVDARGARALQPCDELGHWLKFKPFKVAANGREYGGDRFNTRYWHEITAEQMPGIAAKIKADEEAAKAERDAKNKAFYERIEEIKQVLTPAINEIVTVDAEMGLYKIAAEDPQKGRIVFVFTAKFRPEHEFDFDSKKMVDAYEVEVVSHYRAFGPNDDIRPHTHSVVYTPTIIEGLARVWRVCTY